MECHIPNVNISNVCCVCLIAGRQMDDDNDDDDYYVKKIFRSEKRSNTRPSTLHNVTSTENKKSITGN